MTAVLETVKSFSRATVAVVLTLICLVLPAAAADYPLTIETKFGTTIIPDQPQRVASVDYAGGDNLLALGVQPLTVRYWFGEYADAVWPWARDLLTSEPEVLRGELNFEQIAATEPDVIIAIRSGITDKDYEQLSKIAPVVAVPPGAGDYSLTWDERAQLVGRVLGKQDEAQEMVDAVRAKLASIKDAHPEWAGKTFAMATHYNGSVGVYSASDTSVALMGAMGLTVKPEVAELSTPGEFYFELSEEKLDVIDADVVFWYTSPESMDAIDKLETRKLMHVYTQGREIFLPDTSERNGALSYGTLLSLSFAVDQLEPLIALAIDGDPATAVPAAD